MMRAAMSMWPSMLFGAIMGLIFLPVGAFFLDAAHKAYDTTHPVIHAQARLVQRDDDAVLVEIHGKKMRDCNYVGISAYALDATGTLHDAFIVRVDRPARHETRPVGAQTLGIWRIWPTAGAVELNLWTTHQCDTRLIRTNLANVPLN